MGWRFDKKGDKFRVWSIVVDDYLTGWLSRKEVIAFCYQDRLRSFKKGIIELYLAFPDKSGTMASRILIDSERRETHSKWIQQLTNLEYEKYDQEIDRLFGEALESMGYVVDKLQPIPSDIKAWYEKGIEFHDGISSIDKQLIPYCLSILHGEMEDQKYLSVLVELPPNALYLCIPISCEKLEEYKGMDWVMYLREYKKSDKFYTDAYEDFDGEIHILKEIARKDIQDDWWPGEE